MISAPLSEINQPEPGRILLIGRDFGTTEQRRGQPFQGRAGRVLNECLGLAGLRRSDVNVTNVVEKKPPGDKFEAHPHEDIEEGLANLSNLIDKLQPSVIVPLGNEASWAVVEGWPDRGRGIRGAYDIENRRGYVWTTPKAPAPVVSAVHPAAIDRVWVPFAPLLVRDLQRAKRIHSEGLERPKRRVNVVYSDLDLQRALQRIKAARRVAVDIENFRDQTLRCVGFATSPHEAWVFPPGRHESEYTGLLEDPSIRKVFANGQYDRYFLRTRCGIEVERHEDDTQLGWHSAYPELGGSSEWKNAKPSRKGLAFLASLFTLDEWWKDYEFANERECYELNGRDCCITLDIMNQLDPIIDDLGVRETYEFELSLVPVCMDMQERGIVVDDSLRKERIAEFDSRIEQLQGEIIEAARSDIERAIEDGRVSKPHLFVETWTCPCCRNGAKKREHCTDCAGVVGTGANGAILLDDLPGEGKKQERIDALPPCRECEGDGQRESFQFNANSSDQVMGLLYNTWRLPTRYHNKKPSAREDKVKSLLAHCREKGWEERAAVIEKLLWVGRCYTMRDKQYATIEPGIDGRIRTVLNPSGTETGRLSHGTSFLEASRNLANMANKRAGLDPLFAIRDCFVPSPGMALVEADLSQVEARIAAYMADEPRAIREYKEGLDRYRLFAAELYDKTLAEVTPDQRQLGKMAVLALQYGVKWKTFMDQVNSDEELTGVAITAAEAKRAVRVFHEVYPFYRRWHKSVVREAERNGGWLRTPWGRRRDFFGRTDSKGAREAVQREMVAFLPQSTAVDLLNRGAVKVRERLPEFKLCLQVHDSLMGEVEIERVGEVARKLEELLTIPIQIGRHEVTIPVEVKASTESWGQMEDVELERIAA